MSEQTDVSLMCAEWSIRRVLERYCRHVDDNDFDHVVSLFTEDAVLHFGGQQRRGRDAIRGYFGEVHSDQSGPAYGVHLLGNCIMEVDGDSASASTDFIHVWRTGTGGGGDARAVINGAFLSQIPVAGRYVDRLAHVGEEWLIAERLGSLFCPNPFTTSEDRGE